MAKAIRISELDHWGEGEVDGLLIPASQGESVTKSVSTSYIVSGSSAFKELSSDVTEISVNVSDLNEDVEDLSSYVTEQSYIIDNHSSYINTITTDAANITIWENYDK